MKRVLVMGIGNILLQDEGVGVHVIEALEASSAALPDDVELLDGGTLGAALIDAIASRPKLIVIDALKGEHKPGTVVRFTPDPELEEPPALSLHQFGLADLLRMSRQLGCPPTEVVVFAVQPASIDTGLELTPDVAKAVPKVVKLVLEEAAR